MFECIEPKKDNVLRSQLDPLNPLTAQEGDLHVTLSSNEVVQLVIVLQQCYKTD